METKEVEGQNHETKEKDVMLGLFTTINPKDDE